MDYLIHVYSLPATLEDELTAELWRLGIVGCEIQPEAGEGGARVRVEAYFPADHAEPPSFEDWAARGVRAIGSSELPDRDWLADYRASSRPFPVGRRYVVDPRDPDENEDREAPSLEARAAADADTDGGRRVLSVPAQNAFGTGSHESTRLAIEWLETIDLRGSKVLDVGCGSGILSIIAELEGAAEVQGYDLDAPSVVTARINARRNGTSPTLWAGTGDCLREALSDPAPTSTYDLLLVNVLPERIFGDYPRLLGLLRPGGRVISSGNLLERRTELLARFAELGLLPPVRPGDESEKSEGEWTSFLLEKR